MFCSSDWVLAASGVNQSETIDNFKRRMRDGAREVLAKYEERLKSANVRSAC
jgi:hypothetical protein